MPESIDKEPNIYDIDKRVFSLENITQDLSEGMKSLNESTQQMNLTMEKFISSQNAINDRLTKNLERLTDKQSADKKELYSKIDEVSDAENQHYIENIKEDKNDEKDNKNNLDKRYMWIIGTIFVITNILIAIFSKFGGN